MSIASELTRLQNAKKAISNAIANKGVTVPTGTKLDGMAALIGKIQKGGSLETFHGVIVRAGTGYHVGGGTVYYTSKEGTAGTAYLYDDISIEIDVAKNTWIVVEAPWASEVFTCTNCSSHGTYEYQVLDMESGMAFLIKVTGDNFRVEE